VAHRGMRRHLLALVMLLATCAPSSEAPPADQAVDLVLAELEVPVGTRPLVVYHAGDCANGTGWRYHGGPCVRGVFEPPATIRLSTWPGAAVPQTSLAHEVCHWWLFVTAGDADAGHASPAFEPGGMVDRLRNALWAAYDRGELR
jgi:hypothetical protein